MAHFQQLEFFRLAKDALPEFFNNVKVLEVGSWDVTGSVRQFFLGCDYTGADITSGPGIDLVCQGQDLDMPTNSIDTVVSCECFEHNKYWLETFVNMTRMLRPGGLFIMSCGAPGRIEHGTVRRSAEASLTASFGFSDYYANLSEGDFRKRLSLDVHFEHCGFVIPRYSNDLYFIGIKRAGEVSSVTGDRFNQTLAAMEKIAMPSGTSAGALRKRRLLSMTGRMLERMLGGRRYHDITLKVHRYMTR